MASFGGSVKLSGESEYRRALKEITTNLTVLSSEMKVVNSVYDKNDTSVNAMTKRNEVLNKKLEEQNKVLDEAKKMLNEAKNSTESNAETVAKWQTEVNKAQAEVNKTTKEIEKNEKAMKDSDKATEDNKNSIKDFSEEEEKAGASTTRLGDIIKGNLISDAIKSGLKAIADGISSIGNAMKDGIVNGAQYADNILTLSTQTGIAAQDLQAYSAIAELVDVSTETMTSSMAKNIKQMSKGSEAYKNLGVSVTDANGNLRDSNDVYWECIDALGKVENETERDALAMEIFGKKAQDLNPLIAQGSEGIENLKNKAYDMGAVLSNEALEALGEVDDQMQIFKSTTSSTGNILASAFAPAVSDTIGGINNLAMNFNGLLNAIISGNEEAIPEITETISTTVTDLITNIMNQLPQILNLIENLLSTIGQVLVDNLPNLVDGGIRILTSILNGIMNSLPKIIPVIVQAIMTIVNALIQNLPTILNAGIEILLALVKGIADSLPELIPTIVDAVLTIVDVLIENIPLIIETGIQILVGLIEGLINALPRLIAMLPKIIDTIITTLTRPDMMNMLINCSLELILELSKGLISAIPQLITAIPKIISSLVKGFTQSIGSMKDIGLNLVKGIWNGISDTTQWILDKIKGFGKSVLKGIKSIFGIHSPSTVFRDEIGTNLAKGIGVGFEEEMSDVNNQMANAIQTDYDLNVNSNVSTISSNSQNNTFNNMVEAFKQALKEVRVELDDEIIGSFISDTVERKVYS